MPLSQGNAAYDLSIYEREEEPAMQEYRPVRRVRPSRTFKLNKLKPKRTHTGIQVRSFNATEFRILVISGMVCFVVAAFLFVSLTYQMRENELTVSIEQSRKTLTDLRNDYDGLMVKYDTKMSDAAIEQYAREELGMQKRESFQVEWIKAGSQNEFENEEPKKEGLLEQFAAYFDGK